MSLDMVHLGLQKVLTHTKLMFSVRQYGIDGTIDSWITKWPSNRKQRIIINDIAADWAPVTSGVPQGSVIEPVVYINFSNVGLMNFTSKFAGKAKIGKSIINDRDKLSL